MCGIFGFNGFNDRPLLLRMQKVLHHRGPDDSDIWIDEKRRMSLGHNRLSIIDLSKNARQPISNEDNSVYLVFNGEIYNFQSIKKELIELGHNFKSTSDSEILVHLYEEDGFDMLKKIRGMFAFAIFDARSEQLFIARDHFGIKPLYYSSLNKKFIFASELKALVECSLVSKELDFEAISDYLSYLWAPGSKTILRDVRKLNPGNAMLIKDGEIVREWEFYDIQYNNKLNKISFVDAVDYIDELFEKIVDEQLISDVPLGAFLSGGLDSSLIVSYMRKLKKADNIKAFTIDHRGQSVDGNPNDLPYAVKVAGHLGVDLEKIVIQPSDLLKYIEDFIYILDEPLADPATINVLLITQRAREMGYKVLLSGAGGDDIFTGYRRHLGIMFDRLIFKLPYSIRRSIAWRGGAITPNNVIKRKLKKYFFNIDKSLDERIVSYFLWIDEKVKNKLFSDNVKSQLNNYNSIDSLSCSLLKMNSSEEPLNKMLYLDSKFFLVDHNLNYTDKMSMYNSLEVRVPFLDYRLVDYIAKLPIGFKIKYGETKYILKKLGERYLPKEVIYRPKTGFGVPLRSWIKNDLKPVLKRYLSEDNINRNKVFNYKEIHDLIHLNDSGKIDATYTIFSILCIEMWLNKFFK